MTARKTVARLTTAGALLAAAALGGTALAPGASADDSIGKTPGTYTNYGFPAGTPDLSSVTWSTAVSADPGHASNTFWSHQFGFNQGNGAYIGQQRNGGETSTFLFSVWDVSEAKAGSTGSYCQGFGGEGEGMSCRMKVDWTAGHTYTYTVAHEGGGWFGATIRDVQAHKTYKLGSIKTPATAIKTTGMVDWTEYFEWNDPRATCYDQPYSAAAFGLPKGVKSDGSGTVTGSVSKTSVSDSCTNAAVDTTPAGSVQRLATGNSARGPIEAPGKQCLAPRETDADGHAVTGTAAAFTGCASGTDAYPQGWVLSADGTVRNSSDHCLKADGSSVTVADCKPDEDAAFKVANPAELWTATKDGRLVNKAAGTELARADDGTAVLAAHGTHVAVPQRR